MSIKNHSSLATLCIFSFKAIFQDKEVVTILGASMYQNEFWNLLLVHLCIRILKVFGVQNECMAPVSSSSIYLYLSRHLFQ